MRVTGGAGSVKQAACGFGNYLWFCGMQGKRGNVKRTAWRFEGSGYDESEYHSEVTRERHERDTIYFCDRGPECVRIRKQCCVSLQW